MSKSSETLNQFSVIDTDRIIEMETVALMRKNLKRSSFNLWRKRTHSGVSQKHLAKREEGINRFKCTLQRSISMNKISKRR